MVKGYILLTMNMKFICIFGDEERSEKEAYEEVKSYLVQNTFRFGEYVLKTASEPKEMYDDGDKFIDDILKFLRGSKKISISTSQIQRKFCVGYARAARALDRL